MFKLMGKDINAILGAQTILICTYDLFLFRYFYYSAHSFSPKVFLYCLKNPHLCNCFSGSPGPFAPIFAISLIAISHKRKSKGTTPAATSIASQDVVIGRSRHRDKVFFSEYLILIFQHGILLHEIVFRKSYFLKTNDTNFIFQHAK